MSDIEKRLKEGTEEYKDNAWYQAGFQKAVSILMPEIRERDINLEEIRKLLKKVGVLSFLRSLGAGWNCTSHSATFIAPRIYEIETVPHRT